MTVSLSSATMPSTRTVRFAGDSADAPIQVGEIPLQLTAQDQLDLKAYMDLKRSVPPKRLSSGQLDALLNPYSGYGDVTGLEILLKLDQLTKPGIFSFRKRAKGVRTAINKNQFFIQLNKSAATLVDAWSEIRPLLDNRFIEADGDLVSPKTQFTLTPLGKEVVQAAKKTGKAIAAPLKNAKELVATRKQIAAQLQQYKAEQLAAEAEFERQQAQVTASFKAFKTFEATSFDTVRQSQDWQQIAELAATVIKRQAAVAQPAVELDTYRKRADRAKAAADGFQQSIQPFLDSSDTLQGRLKQSLSDLLTVSFQ